MPPQSLREGDYVVNTKDQRTGVIEQLLRPSERMSSIPEPVASSKMKNLGEINIRRGLPGRPTSAQWCPKGSWKNSFFDSSPTVWFRVHGLYGWGSGWMCSVTAHLQS